MTQPTGEGAGMTWRACNDDLVGLGDKVLLARGFTAEIVGVAPGAAMPAVRLIDGPQAGATISVRPESVLGKAS